MRIDYVQKGDYLFSALTIPDDGVDPDRLGKYHLKRSSELKYMGRDINYSWEKSSGRRKAQILDFI